MARTALNLLWLSPEQTAIDEIEGKRYWSGTRATTFSRREPSRQNKYVFSALPSTHDYTCRQKMTLGETQIESKKLEIKYLHTDTDRRSNHGAANKDDGNPIK